MQVKNDIVLDVSKKNKLKTVISKQGDADSRYIDVAITDNGVAFPIPENAVVTFNVQRSDGLTKAIKTELIDNKVRLPLTKWVLETEGYADCEVSIIYEKKKLTTFKFCLCIDPNILTDNDLSDDENYDLLITLIDDVQQLQKNDKEFINTVTKQVLDIEDKMNDFERRAENGMFKGEKGDKGDKGDAFTYADFTVEQLAGLKGPKGDKGDKGETGDRGFNGLDGADGKSAYELAAENGFDGSVEEYLLSLKGAQGEPGKDGATGPQGEKGDKGESGTTDYNSLEHQPIKVLNVENGTELWDVPEGLWYIDRDIVLKDNNLNDIFLHSCDIVRKNSESYAIITPGWMASGSLFSSLEDTTLLSMENLLLNTDDELNTESTHPVSNRAVTNAVNEGRTVIEYPDDYFILAKKNTEYRYLYPGANKIQIGMPTNSSSTVDFICSLVFRSPETATEFTYSNNLKFTGDECSDGVFVPAAKKVYNIIFWYDGYNYNAVVRGVDR